MSAQWWQPSAGASHGPWPVVGDYVASMQNIASNVTDPELRSGTVRTRTLGLPSVATGQCAAVFHVSSKRALALRCFTNDSNEGEQRYVALAARLSETPVPAFVEATWLRQGIRADGTWWPAVKMEWVEGLSLDGWVSMHLDRPEDLRELASRFASVAGQLFDAGIVHGDLQHGNVLIDSSGDVRLVDYDGVMIVDSTDRRRRLIPTPSEVGHPNYQHPQRVSVKSCDAWTDSFSELVICMSLRALAADRTLWRPDHDQSLVLELEDYEQPGRTPRWQQLARSSDASVVRDAETLKTLCGRDVRVEATLKELETGVIPSGATFTAPTRRKVAVNTQPPRTTWTQQPTASPRRQNPQTSTGFSAKRFFGWCFIAIGVVTFAVPPFLHGVAMVWIGSLMVMSAKRDREATRVTPQSPVPPQKPSASTIPQSNWWSGGAAQFSMNPGSTAGWYNDPSGAYQLRYWDGRQWTGSVSNGDHSLWSPLP